MRIRVLNVNHYLGRPVEELGDPLVSEFWPGTRRIHKVWGCMCKDGR